MLCTKEKIKTLENNKTLLYVEKHSINARHCLICYLPFVGWCFKKKKNMCLESEEDKITKRIEEQIKRDKKLARKDIKVLLLGTGESGKSTFTKQMFIIHNNGFPKAMLDMHRPYAFHNTITFMQRLLKQMIHYEMPLSKPENSVHAHLISSFNIDYENAKTIFGPKDALSPEVVTAIQQLWNDDGVRWVYEKRTEFELSDSASYFFTNVHRFNDPDYVPDNTDMLRIRLPTTGIQEHVFDMPNKVRLRIMDVGGQRGERKIWINCFECVKSIIFLAAMNEYDSYMIEERQMVRRMSVSLDLFKVILSVRLLARASMILFLNKHDLFCEKLPNSPLSRTFPEYDGNENDPEAAADFIKQLFLDRAPLYDSSSNQSIRRNSSRNMIMSQKKNSLVPMRSAVMLNKPEKDEKTPRTIYPHFTTATDTENIEIVFASIKHTIIMANIIDVIGVL